MKSWNQSIVKAQAHKLYRCERLAKTNNPDYISKNGAFNKNEVALKIKKEQEKRHKQFTPSNSITPIRMNRQK